MGHCVAIHCPAKVNLGLEVLHRRADGYHDICTVMQAVDLYDVLTLEVVDGDGSAAPDVQISGPFAHEVPAEGNTLLMAWAIAGGNQFPRLKVSLEKNIPAGAGLGGGSSDGVGMLVGMREVGMLMGGTGAVARGNSIETETVPSSATGGAPVPQIAELALRIGSDCPFFLDAGCQLAGGRGERLTAIERRADFHLVIAVPDFPSPTGAAYSALNRSTTPITPLVTPQLARALEAGDLQLATASMVNDFEPLLLKRQPHYRDWLETLLHSGAAAASITGSGSGFFGLLTSEDEALIAAEELSSRGGFRYCGAHRPVG